jgi:hypothetical protein
MMTNEVGGTTPPGWLLMASLQQVIREIETDDASKIALGVSLGATVPFTEGTVLWFS